VSAVLSGFSRQLRDFQCAEDSARYSQRIRHICPRFGLYETFSAKGAAFSTSPPQDGSTWGTWGQRPRQSCHPKDVSAESAIHFCRDFVSIISTALISTASIFEKHRGIEGALSALDLCNDRIPAPKAFGEANMK
jgi:hypothetical protein